MPGDSQEICNLETRKFYQGDLSLYVDFKHPGGWSRKNIRTFFTHEMNKHPVVGRIIRRMPPAFSSDHAPFFKTPWME
jgi:hypothetical protein